MAGRPGPGFQTMFQQRPLCVVPAMIAVCNLILVLTEKGAL